jgi:hypothetical protein
LVGDDIRALRSGACGWRMAGVETPGGGEMRFVPEDFVVPEGLEGGGYRLVPLGPEHNESDYAAWTSSIEHIRGTPGFAGRAWPDPGMTLEENLGDLRRHAEDFERREGFTYTVLALGRDEVIGCVYIYPVRAGADAGDEAGAEAGAGAGGAVVRSWVRADHAELDGPLREAVRGWLAASWPFSAVQYDGQG